MNLIYVASPYSYKGTDKEEKKQVEQSRFEAVVKVAAKLMKEGNFVFSPIVHCHPLAIGHDLPGDWQYWQNYAKVMLARCNKLLVVKIPGWVESTGISGEIKIAQEMGLPIDYLDF